MVTEESEQLFSTEASHVQAARTVSADRCKVRFVLPLVGVMAAVCVFGGWTLGRKHATAASTTAFRRENQAHEVSTIALRQQYAGQREAYGYKDVGKGGCLLPSGEAIKGKYWGVKEHRAQAMCDTDPTCKGYVASTGCLGVFLFSHPDDTEIKGGGDPPKDSHSWKRAPCMAKDLDMSYAKLGYGKCITADGDEPENDFDENVQDNGVTCRERCSSKPECKGFSAATVNFKGCYLWKEGNLKAGGSKHRWNVASCYVKESAGIPEGETPAPVPETPPPPAEPEPSKPAATGDDVKYTDLGKGKCRNADRTQLKHKWYASISEKSLKEKCNKDSACYGYSRSLYGSGLLWMEGNLQGKGDSWGGAKCKVKQ